MNEEINLTPTLDWRHAIVRFVVMQVVQFFYPQVTVVGQENIPPLGQPVIYVVNHPNFLLDQVMLTIGLQRRVACMGKSTFFAHPISRLALETFGGLPVYRKRDDGLPFGPRGDAHERNKQILAHCRGMLHRGESFALFPEGTTHSAPTLLPLQSGASRIGLETEAEANWSGQVWIVPVGVWYEDKTRFRSWGCVAFGKPLLPRDYADLYAQSPQKAIETLTADTTDRLRAIVATANRAGKLSLMTPVLSAWQTLSLTIFLIMTAPLAILGHFLHYIPYRLTLPLVTRFFDKRDTRLPTGKMLANLVMWPLNWLILSLMGWAIGGFWRGVLLGLLTPLLGYFAIRWLETEQKVMVQYKPLTLKPSPRWSKSSQ